MAGLMENPAKIVRGFCVCNALVIFVLLLWCVGCADVDSADSATNKPPVAASNAKRYCVQADAASVPKSSKEVTLHAFIPKQQIELGQSLNMQLEVTIPSTFYLYRSVGHGNALKPVVIEARANHASLKVGNVQLDNSSKSLAGNQVYTNRFTVNIPVTFDSVPDNDQSVIDLQMSYQICNDLQCLAPSTISLAVPVSITQE